MPQLPTSEHYRHFLHIPLVHLANGVSLFRKPFFAPLNVHRVPFVDFPLLTFQHFFSGGWTPRPIPPRGRGPRAIDPRCCPRRQWTTTTLWPRTPCRTQGRCPSHRPPPGLRIAGGPASDARQRRDPRQKTTRVTPSRSRASTIVGWGHSTTSTSTLTLRSPWSTPSCRLLIGNVVLGSCSSWTGRGPSCCDGAVERHLILPRAVFADGFGTANGRAVKKYFLFWVGEWRGLVFRNSRFVLPKSNNKQKNRQAKHQIERICLDSSVDEVRLYLGR